MTYPALSQLDKDPLDRPCTLISHAFSCLNFECFSAKKEALVKTSNGKNWEVAAVYKDQV